MPNDKTNRLADKPLVRVAGADLDSLMSTLEVTFVRLSECLVSPGWRLELGGPDAPGIHYNLAGMGRLLIGDNPPIDLNPHTLVVVPAGIHFYVEVPSTGKTGSAMTVVEGRAHPSLPGPSTAMSPETATSS